MRNEPIMPIDEDDVLSAHYLPADLSEKFADSGRSRRKHFWIWTLIVSTMLTTMGLAVWLANKL
jgi:hypothetical protein